MHLHNYIPITREDTRRGSTPQRCAEQSSVPRLRQTPRKQSAAGTACGAWQIQRKEVRPYIVPTKMKAAKLLQQSGGTPRFGKRRRHLQTV